MQHMCAGKIHSVSASSSMHVRSFYSFILFTIKQTLTKQQKVFNSILINVAFEKSNLKSLVKTCIFYFIRIVMHFQGHQSRCNQ